MAIAFARLEYVQRSRGASTVQKAAYNARIVLEDQRTGFSYPKRGVWSGKPPIHHEIMIPQGAHYKFHDPSTLWNSVELFRYNRKDSVLAREFVLALPNDSQLTHIDLVQMVRDFVKARFVSHGLAVQIDIHDVTSNKHAHILTTTRKIEGDTLSRFKAPDNVIRHISGRPIVVEADLWGEIWKTFQDDWFISRGHAIRVSPVGSIPQPHLGPRRHQHPLDARVQRAAEIRQLNAALGHPRAAQTPQQAHPDAIAQSHSPSQARLEIEARLDHVASGLRPLTVQDVAREFSPEYAALVKRAGKLHASIEWATKMRANLEHYIAVADNHMEYRRRQIGMIRTALHRTRLHQDPETATLENWRRANKRARDQRWAIRIKTAQDRLAAVEQQAIRLFDQVRPIAEAELQRRQKIAAAARDQLASLPRFAISREQRATHRPRVS